MFGSKKSKKNEPSARELATEWEKKILATQGLIEGENVWISDVEIKGVKGEKDKQFIHTIEVGRQNEEKLLFIHGYGATSAYMWKIMAQLQDNFHVYAIDQYGQGLSSRPKFKLKRSQYDETVSFFCDAIEEWRVKTGLDDFSLMGHSFGGYTAVQYINSYSPNLKKLYLLSPAGMTSKTKDEIEDRIKTKMKFGWFKRQFAKSVFYIIQDCQYTPFQLMNLRGGRKKGITKYYQADRLTLSEKESSLFGKYFFQVTSMPISSDKALGTFLNYGMYSRTPGLPFLKKLHEEGKLPPTTMWYGETDWMDFAHTKEGLTKLGLDSVIKYEMIEKAGHQIVFNNPSLIAQKITEDYKFTWTAKEPKDYVDPVTLDIKFDEKL